MTICILCHREPNPSLGGIERISYSLAKELSKNDVFVIFVYSISSEIRDYDKIGPTYRLPDNCIESDVNTSFLLLLLEENGISIVLNQAAHNIGFVNLCAKLLAERSCLNIVSAIHFAPHQEWIAMKCNRFLPKFGDAKPFMFQVKRLLNDLFLETKKGIVLSAEVALLRTISQTSKKVVVLSEAFVDEFNRMVPANNYIAIPNMIENVDTNLSFYQKEKIVLYVGRLEYGLKRVDRLLYIWRDVEKQFPDWKLQIVGDGEYRFSFEGLSKHLGLKHVSFEGTQDPEGYYKNASIICLTSSCEGFGMVLIEAMQCGCVPIAYNSYAALSDIIEDGVSGYAVAPFNQEEYVTKLSRLMSDDKLRQNMATSAVIVPSKFEAHIIAQKWIDLFESLS